LLGLIGISVQYFEENEVILSFGEARQTKITHIAQKQATKSSCSPTTPSKGKKIKLRRQPILSQKFIDLSSDLEFVVDAFSFIQHKDEK
jgi:hypothetical protein